MPTALISGANKGLGFATARLLGGKGIAIWLGSRSEERGRRAEAELRSEGIDARFLKLDVADPASIAAAAREIEARSDVLDMLINNAGVMDEGSPSPDRPSRPSAVPFAPLALTYATNVFGPILTIQALLPLLRRSPSPRIVNVSSRLGSFGHQTDPEWPARWVNKLGYSSSKAALNMATVMFAYELRDTPIKVNAVSPGTIATDLNGVGADKLADRPGFIPVEEGAALVAECALIPDDGPSGKFFGPGGELPW